MTIIKICLFINMYKLKTIIIMTNLELNLSWSLNSPKSENHKINFINPKINQGGFNVASKNQDNVELVNKIKQIISIPNLEERKELLGETIFYFLLRFIPTFNLNQTSGKFSDDVLCSKLTGIFLHTDEKELVNILSNVEILVLTIKDVINVS